MQTEQGVASGNRPAVYGKLICIGRNYAQHAAEMQSAVPDEPMIFLKPSSAIIGDGGEVILPAFSKEVHHEVELVALIGRTGKNIPEMEALDYVVSYAVGLDMTARDLQARAKKNGEPWAVAKGFDTFAPLGPLLPAAEVEDPQHLKIQLLINGKVRQLGNTADMIFTVAHLVSYCSRIFTLYPGDLLYTGTPDGVGPVAEGDRMEALIEGFPPLRVSVRR